MSKIFLSKILFNIQNKFANKITLLVLHHQRNSNILKRKFNFDEKTLVSIDSFITNLDKVINVSVTLNDKFKILTQAKILKQTTFNMKLYQNLNKKHYHYSIWLNTVLVTLKKGEHIIKLKCNRIKDITGWECNTCNSKSSQLVKDKVVEHLLSNNIWKISRTRQISKGTEIIKSIVAKHSKFQEIPKKIKMGQYFLLLKIHSHSQLPTTILNLTHRTVNTIIGDKEIPQEEIYKVHSLCFFHLVLAID